MIENFTKLMTLAIAGVLTSSVMAQNATTPIIKGEAAKATTVKQAQVEKPATPPIIQTKAAEAGTWPNYTVTYSPDGSRMFNKTTYEYDKAGRIIERTGYYLSDNDWIASNKTVYEYDETGNQTLYVYYYWGNNTWVGDEKYVYGYDEAGYQTFYEYYRWENNTWVGNYKTVYEYDEEGEQTMFHYYTWNNGDWALNSSNLSYPFSKRVDYIVDGENIRFGYPMGLGTGWYYSYSFPAKNKYDTKYDSNGNLTFCEFINAEGVTYKFNIKYDKSKPTLVEMAYNGEAVTFKAEYEYDGDERCTSFEQFYLDGTTWKSSGYKAIIAYGGKGERRLFEIYTRDWENEVWILMEKTLSTYEYDANDRTTLHEYHNISNDYEYHYKYVYEYDAKGRTISYEYYYVSSNNDYISHYKETFEFDSHGNQYLSYYYTPANGDWEMVSYTVSYPNTEKEYVTNETITTTTPNVYIADNTLYIYGAQTEQVSVYSISGVKLYEAKIASDVATINATPFPKGSVLIVKGSSGWVKKLIK